jgi:predicted component of type VI protein secretion system
MKFLKFLTPLILLLILLTGCASKSEDEKKPIATKTILQIRTNEDTNHGTPFYVVVKPTDYSQFLTDDYKKVATEAMVGDKDPTKFNTTCFIPGETKTIEVENKDDKPVGVYFIFTHPGEEWKYLTDEKEGRKVKFLLGENEIKSIRAF